MNATSMSEMNKAKSDKDAHFTRKGSLVENKIKMSESTDECEEKGQPPAIVFDNSKATSKVADHNYSESDTKPVLHHRPTFTGQAPECTTQSCTHNLHSSADNVQNRVSGCSIEKECPEDNVNYEDHQMVLTLQSQVSDTVPRKDESVPGSTDIQHNYIILPRPSDSSYLDGCWTLPHFKGDSEYQVSDILSSDQPEGASANAQYPTYSSKTNEVEGQKDDNSETSLCPTQSRNDDSDCPFVTEKFVSESSDHTIACGKSDHQSQYDEIPVQNRAELATTNMHHTPHLPKPSDGCDALPYSSKDFECQVNCSESYISSKNQPQFEDETVDEQSPSHPLHLSADNVQNDVVTRIETQESDRSGIPKPNCPYYVAEEIATVSDSGPIDHTMTSIMGKSDQVNDLEANARDESETAVQHALRSEPSESDGCQTLPYSEGGFECQFINQESNVPSSDQQKSANKCPLCTSDPSEESQSYDKDTKLNVDMHGDRACPFVTERHSSEFTVAIAMTKSHTQSQVDLDSNIELETAAIDALCLSRSQVLSSSMNDVEYQPSDNPSSDELEAASKAVQSPLYSTHSSKDRDQSSHCLSSDEVTSIDTSNTEIDIPLDAEKSKLHCESNTRKELVMTVGSEPSWDMTQTEATSSPHTIVSDLEQQFTNRCREKCDTNSCSEMILLTTSSNTKSHNELTPLENSAQNKMSLDKCPHGETVLHVASAKGMLKTVKELISRFDFDPNVRDTNYQATPLHHACQHGHLDVVTYFILEQECDASITDSNYLTPLHYAARKGHLNIVKYLGSQQTCNTEAKDDQEQTALHYSCRFGHINIVGFLISELKCDIEAKDRERRTPLHLACKFRHCNIVKYLLLEKLCNPNAEDNKKMTPLHYTCTYCPHDTILRIDVDLVCSIKLTEVLLADPRCNVNIKNDNGDTALHLACKNDKLKIVQHILTKESCNPNARNKAGQTPLQLTSHLKVISELINKGANPVLNVLYKWQKRSYVRDACLKSWPPEQVRNLIQTATTPQRLFVYLINEVEESQAVEAIHCIIKYTTWNLDWYFGNGRNALHIACKASKHNIVKLLLSEGKCNANMKTNKGTTPLQLPSTLSVKKELLQHKAYPNDFLKKFISKKTKDVSFVYSLNILTADAKWNLDVALQIACEQNCPIAVKFLLEEKNCNPNSTNSAKRSPLQLTSDPEIIQLLIRHGANPKDVYKFHGQILGTKQPLTPSVKVFVVGNSSVGKSTLTAAIQVEPFFEMIQFRSRKVSGVDEKTAGVIPYEFSSKKFGRITLYDFAGQREFYSSHAALLCNAIQSSPPVFLLVINVSENDEEINKNLIFWLSFIENQCTCDSNAGKPHVIIIGSHADVVQARGEDPKLKKHVVNGIVKEVLASSSMEYVGFVAMNCCYGTSQGMRELRSFMKESCCSVRSQTIGFRVHCFLVYLHDKFRDCIAVRLKLICKQLKSEESNSVDDVSFTYFVPTDLDELCDFCSELSDRGHILFLRNSSKIENSWIIIDKPSLLSEVNGTIFAPANFKEHCNLASSTGVVPLSKIKERFINHNHEMIIGYLSHLEFCQEISDNDILELIYEQEICMQSERYFFFPGLVTMKIPDNIWKSKPQQFDYHCGWMLHRIKPEQFFDSRFLQVLQLRLAFSFALAKLPADVDETLPAIQRECSIWTNGIFWGNRCGFEILVEVYHNEAVIVLMRCEDITNGVFNCIKLRSQIVTQVMQCAKEFCPKLQTREFFIDPSETTQYPLVKATLSELTRYPIEKIAKVAITSGLMSSVVLSSGTTSLKRLLKFEPYAALSTTHSQMILQEHNTVPISDNLLREISEYGYKSHYLVKMFDTRASSDDNNTPAKLYSVMNRWKCQTSKRTFQCLRKKFSQFSIFAGRELDVLVSIACINIILHPTPYNIFMLAK